MSGTAAPLAGVIGWPIGHSRSPALHGHWLARYGLPGAYVALPVAPNDLANALGVLPRIGFVGCNVTLPHKEAVFQIADQASARARRLGAANTLVFLDGGGIHADNTDGFGFLENLRQGAPAWRADAGPAVVFGAGGASRAVVDALAAAGAPEIRLLNRTKSRAETLAAVSDKVTVVDWSEGAAAMDGAATLINTTSLGMAGQPPFPFAFDAAPLDALATDIVYTPLETPFLQAAMARGLATVDGLGMLLHQGRPGFAAWFGHEPEVDAALRAAVLGDA